MTTKKQNKKKKEKKISETFAIVCLLLNVLVIPGLGSLIANKKREGIWQLVLSIVGFPLVFVLVGFPILIGAWIWGLITGVQLIKESQ